jgi:DNA-binding NarL/FixJ family response regulator
VSGREVTLLVVDDHDGLRNATATLFAGAGFAVIGAAATGAEAVRLAKELHPDVVLLDVRLPDASGFDVARDLAALDTAPQIVLMSSLGAADVSGRVDAEIVRGFIPKSDLTPSAVRRLLDPR